MAHISLKHGIAAMILSVALLGCSDPKNQIFDTETGKHAVNWLPSRHAAAASSGTTTIGNAIASTGLCVDCHGEDLAGGISGAPCTECHLGGPTSIHPQAWFPIVLAHGPSISSGATTPAQCASQYCHAPGLTGVPGSGPACDACHTLPFTPGSIVCGSCHAIPPAGTRYPGIAGRHGAHASFTGTTTAACSVCHNGSDGASGAVTHYDGIVDIAFLVAYNAQTGGPAQYNADAMNCTGVSCHGGQSTPSWRTGSIDVTTQCTRCHQFNVTQYNSFSSGEHDKHVNGEGFFCTECHDTAKLASVHFNDLNTTTMGQAALTLRDALNYTGTAGGAPAGNCTINCHGENHSNRGW